MYGTLQYLAPEVVLFSPCHVQAAHGTVISPSVDMWALGCTLYLLLTGSFLFDGEDELSWRFCFTVECAWSTPSSGSTSTP